MQRTILISRLCCYALLASLLVACTAPAVHAAQQCSTLPGGTAPQPPGTWTDITVTTRMGLPVFNSATGLHRYWRSLLADAKDGDEYTESWVNLDAHTGTHVDAPRHFLPDGPTIEQLDLSALMGPALVVEVPPGSNITGVAGGRRSDCRTQHQAPPTTPWAAWHSTGSSTAGAGA